MKQLPGRDTVWFKFTVAVILVVVLLALMLIAADVRRFFEEPRNQRSRDIRQTGTDETATSDGSFIPYGVIRSIGRKKNQGGGE
jgi:hypothetical protein